MLTVEDPGLTFHVVGEADDAPGLLTQAKTAQPDLVLLDWELPGISPVNTLLALRLVCRQARVIALSAREEIAQAARDAGAAAFVSKTDLPEHLLGAIQRLLAQGGGLCA
jgi:DNA-binding NarL/FixJ family response regulator